MEANSQLKANIFSTSSTQALRPRLWCRPLFQFESVRIRTCEAPATVITSLVGASSSIPAASSIPAPSVNFFSKFDSIQVRAGTITRFK